MLRISAHSSRQLQAIILAGKQLDRETRAEIRRQTRTMVRPEWEKAVREHAATRLEHRVLGSSARVAVSDQNVQLQAARVGRALAGGVKPSDIWAPVEFGAPRGQRTSYTGRRGGTSFPVKNRRTTQQLRPVKRTGYVIYPSAADIIPRIASLWVQTAVRGLHEAFEKGS